jgi:hypothetical protein
MTPNERLNRTIRGQSVDRPAVCFYEIDGFKQVTDDDNPYNIYNDPSWKPLIDLAREKSDSMPRQWTGLNNQSPDPADELKTWNEYEEGDVRINELTIKCPNGHTLTQVNKREREINTVWQTKHLLENEEDLEAYLTLPEREFDGEVDITAFLEMEEEVGEDGLVMCDTGDPLCAVAGKFEMGAFTIVAMMNPELFHRALQREARFMYKRIEAVAKALPGKHWRVVGSEYASPPYLPPNLYKDYLVDYTKPIIDIIHKYDGFARIHSHGNIKDILDHIVSTGCMGLDPIEPPHQGDVELAYVRENYGKDLVLFGNIESRDLEHLANDKFEEKVKQALDEGTRGEGRGFVLLPSACPYGRKLPALAMKNYESMIELTEKF